MESVMSDRKAGFNILASVLVLVLGAFVAALANGPIYKYWLASPFLNSLILTIFIAGAIYALYQMLHLQREFGALEQVQRRCGSSNNVKWLNDDFVVLLPQSLVRERLLLYFEQVDRGSSPNGDNHSERINLTLSMHTGLTRYIASLLVFMGLLGTFVGLLQAIGAIEGILVRLPTGGLSAESGSFFNILKDGLALPLHGMATAFSTSVFGLVSSLLLGFLHVQLTSAQSRYISRLETMDAAVFRPSFDVRAGGETVVARENGSAFFSASQKQLKENLDRLMTIVERTEGMQANFREVMMTIGREIEMTNAAITRLAANQDLMRNALSSMVEHSRGTGESQRLMLAELQSLNENTARLNAGQKEHQTSNREFHDNISRLIQSEVGALSKLPGNGAARKESA